MFANKFLHKGRPSQAKLAKTLSLTLVEYIFYMEIKIWDLYPQVNPLLAKVISKEEVLSLSKDLLALSDVPWNRPMRLG